MPALSRGDRSIVGLRLNSVADILEEKPLYEFFVDPAAVSAEPVGGR